MGRRGVVGSHNAGRRPHRAVAALAAALVVSALLNGGAGARSSAGGTLHVSITQDIDSLDPALAFQTSSWEIERATCSTLMGYPDAIGPQGLTAIPEAAADYPAVSADRRTYTFTIRPALRFSDGTPLTAANFAAAIDRDKNPAMQSYAATLLTNVTSVRAHGRTLSVQLARPNGDLLHLLALPFFCPVPTDLPVDPNGIDVKVSSGPYIVASRAVGREIVLARNPRYRGPRQRNVDSVVIDVGATPEEQVAAAEAGTVDYVPYLGALSDAERRALVRRYGLREQLRATEFAGTYYLALNTERPIFRDNVPLRRALNYAIDRAEIVRQYPFLSERRTDQLLPSSLAGFVDKHVYPLSGADLATAKRLARGHLRGGHVVFYSRSTPFWRALESIVVYNLRQLGFTVDVKEFSTDVMSQKAGTRGEPYDMAIGSWYADTPDPGDFLEALLDGRTIKPTGNTNLSYFDQPEFQRELAAADRLGAGARDRAFGRLSVEVMRRWAPVVPLMSPVVESLTAKRVNCIYRPDGLLDYGAVCLR